MLHIYNSLSRRKEKFQPRIAGKVALYVCGITAYDFCHLGHARMLVVFDMVVRYMRWLGLDVNFIRNITDIDDKIITRAKQCNQTYDALTARYIDEMHIDSKNLFILPPDYEPRATEYIDAIIVMVQQLIDRSLAYVADNGDVYYNVRKFQSYGLLAGKKLDDLKAGARVQMNPDKQDPLDFVLWKAAKPDEPSWPSPWGAGRPGWHIECSVMSTKCLGSHFDIHGGGLDLKFPHHENEIAQSEGVSGKKFVNIWMHNGYIQVDDEKMSKSLGNFLTIRKILERDKKPQRMGEILRFMMLNSHYRSPLNYSDDTLEQARAGLTRIYLALQKYEQIPQQLTPVISTEWAKRFTQSMDDDFNTPEAISVLFELTRSINRLLDQSEYGQAYNLGQTLKQLGSVLGIFNFSAEEFLGIDKGNDADEKQIEELIEQRVQARQQKNWSLADALRQKLDAMGVVVEDCDGASNWRRR